MRIKGLLVCLMVFSAVSVWAQALGHVAMEDIENYFKSLDGVVVEVSSNDTLLVDIGSSKGAVEGLQLTIYNAGEPVVHPVSGKILGYKESTKGSLTIETVYEEYSIAKYTGTAAVGERVTVEKPVPVKFEFNGLNDEDRLVINTALKANMTVLNAGEAALYTIKIARAGRILSYEIDRSGKAIFAGTALPQDAGGSKEGIIAMEGAELPKGRYMSIAVGNIRKDDNQKYMVAVQDDTIDIFDINKFEKKESINTKLREIAAVEVADLDGDGVDEIFISNTSRGSYAQSAVFRHDGKNYVEVQKEIPWLFRSTKDVDGRRRIIAQAITTDAEYAGEIFYVTYKNGKYEKGGNITGSVGKRLFGFGMTPDEKDRMFIQIAKDGRLVLSTFKGNIYASTDNYGDTFAGIKPKAVRTAATANPDSDMQSPGATIEHTIYVNPRIEVLDGKHIVLVKNNLYTRMLQQSLVFSDSEIGVYKYEYSQLRKSMSVKDLDPVVVDIFVYEESGIYYLLALTTSNNLGLVKGASGITRYRLDIRD